jgi:hypothetical protein
MSIINENNIPDVPAAGDKSKGAKYIAAHPEEYGFSWGSGAIAKGAGKDKVTLREDCPHIVIPETLEQLNLFVRTFGAVFVAKGLNGTSVKVQCDRVNRDTLEKNRKVTNDELREKIVSSILLGVIVRSGGVPQTKYVVNGQVFTSEEAAKTFSANAERITALEKAQAFLAMAAENGIDPTVARSMAKAQWPLAFEKVEEPIEEQDEDENDEGTEN